MGLPTEQNNQIWELTQTPANSPVPNRSLYFSSISYCRKLLPPGSKCIIKGEHAETWKDWIGNIWNIEEVTL